MKTNHLSFFLFLIILLNSNCLISQSTEDFESETIGATTFTDNGQSFTITNGAGETTYDIEFFGSGGWNGTGVDNQFIDNSTGSPTIGNGSSFSITTTDGTDITVKSFFLFVSNRSITGPGTPTTITIEGKKDGGNVFTITKSSGIVDGSTFTPSNGFTFIDFTLEGGTNNSNENIDELIISSTGNADYLALDAFTWDIETCTDPTIPTITSSPTTICNGNDTTLNISGTLNDATQWSVYTGSCGGTLIGTTTGSSIIVTPTSPSTTYFVRGEGGCVTPGSCGTITVNTTDLDNASFNYSASAYCIDDTDPTPIITGLTGGTFSSTAGLSINASTGAIDVSTSTPGTYTVTYTTTGTCPNSETTNVSINQLDDANFSYSASAYCIDDTDPTPTITGLTGGTFSSTAGLSINASTGAIDVSTSTPGTYTVTYTTTGTCPNSETTSVTITQVDISTTTNNITISANAVGASYQWLDCNDDFSDITGATNSSYTPTSNGSYAVRVSENGCSNISECVTISTLDVESDSLNSRVLIYPNPTKDIFEIFFSSNQKKLKINIYSYLGQLVQTRVFENSNRIQIKLNQPSGVYFVECTNDEGKRLIRKIIKL